MGIELAATANDRLEVLDDVPDVDVHRRRHDTVALPEGDELPVGEAAADDDVVAGVGVADVLHAEVVLIREEVREAVVGVAAAGRVGAGGDALVEGVGPVLDTQVAAEVGVPGGGDITGGEHVGGARAQLFVDDDAVVDIEAGGGGELDPRHDTDTDDDEIGGLHVAVAQHHLFHGGAAAQLGDARLHPQAHAVVGVQLAEHGADLVAEDALEGHRERVDEDDLGAQLSRRGTDLRPDPTGADHRHAAGGTDRLTQPVGVVDRAEVVDAVER